MPSSIQPLTQASKTAKPTAGIAAFFDMDRTLLRESSGRLYLKYLRENDYLGWRQWLVIMWQVIYYMSGLIDFPRLMGRLMTHVANASEAEAWRISNAWFESSLQYYIADGARERIVWHQEQGHHVVIVSAATPYAVGPVAQSLGVDYLATRLEIVEGRFTGRLTGPACYGVGKVALAAAYANRLGFALCDSYFYTDSHHDLPLLEIVGHPIAVNPSRRLARIASQRAWPVMRFY